MKKLQMIDEHGRSKAMERYGKEYPKPTSQYGHSQSKQSLGHKFETPLPKSAKSKPQGR